MILETLTDPIEGLAGPDFYAYWLDQKNLFEFNDQYILDAVQLFFETYIGRGVLFGSWTGDLVTDAGGLVVDIAAHTSIIKWPVVLDDITSWVMTDDDTRYLWELQDNTVDTPSYAITDDLTDPSTNETPAHLLASITTAAGAITDITNLYNVIYAPLSNNPEVEEIFGPTQSGTHLKDWDASVDDRTGGTVSDSLVVDYDVDESKPITILRGNREFVHLHIGYGVNFTAPRTFDIDDPIRPIDNDADIREDVIIKYTPL